MLKLGVLCAVAFVLFQKINAFPSGFKLPGKMDLGLATLFLGIMPLNWFIEWLKWKAIVAQKKIHSSIRWHSFLSGIISSVITPAYAGNFIGRMFYFDKKDRKEVILNTIVGNGSQFIISISMGLIAFVVLYTYEILNSKTLLFSQFLSLVLDFTFLGTRFYLKSL